VIIHPDHLNGNCCLTQCSSAQPRSLRLSFGFSFNSGGTPTRTPSFAGPPTRGSRNLLAVLPIMLATPSKASTRRDGSTGPPSQVARTDTPSTSPQPKGGQIQPPPTSEGRT